MNRFSPIFARRTPPLFALLVALLSMAAFPGPLKAQGTQDYPGSRALLLAYYTAINTHDYTTAYTFWSMPQQTFNDFAAGFATTARVEPYFGFLQTPPAISQTETGRVPAVLVGYHLDGSIESYGGCFALVYPAALGRWQIVTGDFHLIGAVPIPDAATLSALLQIDCYNPPAIPPVANPQADLPQVQFIRAYFDAINRTDYATAYGSWLQPIPGPKPNGAPAVDYRLPYPQFATGYQNTAYVYVYPGVYNETGASMGHGYLDGLLPAVLVSQQRDGSFQSYAGCYVIGRLDASRYGIVNGKFSVLTPNSVPDGLSLLAAQNVDCIQLAIPN